MREVPVYAALSLAFFIIIGAGLSYCWYFYPDDQPFGCQLRSMLGHNCPTCGFSRAFSSFMHLRWKEGAQLSPAAVKPFLFFVSQFMYRGGVSFYYFTTRNNFNSKLIKTDVVISISLFLLAFLPILINF